MKRLMVLSVFAVMFLLSTQVSASVNWDSYLMNGYMAYDEFNSETKETTHTESCDVSTGVSPLERCGRVTAWDSGSSWDAGADIKTLGGASSVMSSLPPGSWQTFTSYNTFLGIFTADGNMLHFNYSYNYNLSIFEMVGKTIDYADTHARAGITVINNSTGQTLFGNYLFNESLTSRGGSDSVSQSYVSDVYSVPITQGDEIYVIHDTLTSGESRDNSIVNGNLYSRIDFSTSNTVAPEPVSSILFVAGGVTLGLRRLRKKIVYS